MPINKSIDASIFSAIAFDNIFAIFRSQNDNLG